MLRILKITAILLSLAISSVFAEDASGPAHPAGACESEFSSEKGYITPKPFSSTICPQDKAIRLATNHFPATMEAAINLLDLEHKKDIIRAIGKRTQSDENKENYGSELLNIEEASLNLQALAVLIAKVLIGIQIFIAAFIALKDGQFGGKTFGGYKTITRFGIGIILISPIPIFSTLMDKSVDVLLIQILLAMVAISAIGAANVVVSTIGYLTLSDLPDERDKSFSQTHADEALVSIPLTKSRLFIEDAVCQNQSALLGVYEGASEYSLGAARTLQSLGKAYSYSLNGDGFSSWAEFNHSMVGDKLLGTVITKGVGLETEPPGSTAFAPITCSSAYISKPVWTIPFEDDVDEIAPIIDLLIYKMPFDKLGNHAYLMESWSAILSKEIIEKEKRGGINADNKVEFEARLLAAANYFFDLVSYRASGGDLAEVNTKAIDLYNQRAKLADDFAKEVLAQRCYTDREAYIRTKSTVKSLKRGSIGSADFSLKCAQVDVGGINLAFEADSTSPESYISDTLKMANEANVKLQSLYVKLYQSIEGLEGQIEATRNEALAEVTRTIFYKDKSTATATVEEAGVAMRVEGFGSFAHLYTALMKSLNHVFMQTAKIKLKAIYTSPELMTVNYSATDSYLTTNASDLKRDFQSDKVNIPEFVYSSPSLSEGEIDDYESKVLSAVESQFSTDQGGTFGAAGRAQSMGDWSTGEVINTLGISTSDGVYGISQVAISGIFTNILNKFSIAGSSKENGLLVEFDAIKHHKVLEACGRGYTQSQVVQELGEDGAEMYVMLCPSYVMHPLFKNQEIGNDITKAALVGIVIYYAIEATGKAHRYIKKKKADYAKEKAKKNKKGSEQHEQNNTKQQQDSEAQDKKNFLERWEGKVPDSVKSMVTSHLSSAVLWVALVLFLILGLIMSVFAPLVPILTYMFSYLGWAILFIQLMVISAFVALTLFIIAPNNESNSAPEKSFTGVFINLFLRPFAMIVGFVVAYIITYVTFMVYDFAMVNILAGIGGTGDFFFAPFEIVMDAVFLVILWMAHLFIIKTVFEICLKAPNMIIKQFGAETLEAREGQVMNMSYAAMSAAVDDNVSVVDDLEKRKLDRKVQLAAREELTINRDQKPDGEMPTDQDTAGNVGAPQGRPMGDDASEMNQQGVDNVVSSTSSSSANESVSPTVNDNAAGGLNSPETVKEQEMSDQAVDENMLGEKTPDEQLMAEQSKGGKSNEDDTVK